MFFRNEMKKMRWKCSLVVTVLPVSDPKLRSSLELTNISVIHNFLLLSAISELNEQIRPLIGSGLSVNTHLSPPNSLHKLEPHFPFNLVSS